MRCSLGKFIVTLIVTIIVGLTWALNNIFMLRKEANKNSKWFSNLMMTVVFALGKATYHQCRVIITTR
jgi:hypothetical protein